MSETAAAPAIAAPEAAPAAPAEIKVKPIPVFKTSAEGRDDGASRALKEGREKAAKAGIVEAAPGRDPKTGKFLSGEAVPTERREKASGDEGGTLSPDFQAREQMEAAPPEGTPEASAPEGNFAFEFNGKTFSSQKELSSFLKNMDTRARSSQQLAAQLQNVLNRIEAGDVPKEVEREVEQRGAETAVAPSPKNPFEVDFIDTDHPDQGKLWGQVEKDLQAGETTLALGRLFKAFEERLKTAMSYRDHTRGESLAGVNAYFGALNQIHSIGTFFKSQMDRVDDATGEPLYPLAAGKQGKEQIASLTRFLHQRKLARTPENFEYAYDKVVRYSKEQGAASTQRQVEAPVDHSQAASAAAATALRSARALPSPREESRPLSLIEQMREETLRPTTAKFRGSR